MQTLLNAFSRKLDTIEGLVNTAVQQQSAASHSLSPEAVLLKNRDESLLADVTSSVQTLGTSLGAISSTVSSQHDRQMLRLEEIHQKIRPSTPAKNGGDHDSLFLVCSGTRQIAIGLYRILVALVGVLLEAFGQLIHSVALSSAYLHFAHAIPLTISFITSDNIQLVDVLGRRHSLPFQNIRSWSKFAEMLELRFRHHPGSDKVRAGQFRILKAKKEGVVLEESNWAESIEPGMHLLMSVEIVKLRRQVQRGSCLRQFCLGILRTTGSHGLRCSACGLDCYEEDLRQGTRKTAPVYGPQDFRAEVERMREYLRKLERQSKRSRGLEPQSTTPKHARISDAMILRELHQCVSESKERAVRRENEGWLVQNQVIADLRRTVAEMKERQEKEAYEREALELRVFLRIHIRATVYESSNDTTKHDDVVTSVTYKPPPTESTRRVVRRRTLADIVMEETSAWATTCLAGAIGEGAEVDTIDPLYGTALQASASTGSLAVSSFLLERGADPLRESPAHRSAIHAAAMHDRGEVLGLLLKSCHKALYSGGSAEIEKKLLFRDTCDAALRASTLRGCNTAVLALLNFTDRVHVGTAIWSENELTMKIIMGEALRLGKVTMGNCVSVLQKEGANGNELGDEYDENRLVYRKMDLRL
jgi:hypothetical protein